MVGRVGGWMDRWIDACINGWLFPSEGSLGYHGWIMPALNTLGEEER